jgi:Uma2 family endonuclease
MTAAVQITPILIPAKFTLDQYHQMIAAGILDDAPIELLHGELVQMSPEGEPHAYSSHEAAKYLVKRLDDRAEVRQAKPITIPAIQSEPEPDIALVQPLGREYRQHHPYPENIFWVIEYSNSSLQKDLQIKTKTYATANIPEYWVINLQTMELIVLRDPENGEYRSQVILTQGIIHPIAFPEIDIDVTRLLA